MNIEVTKEQKRIMLRLIHSMILNNTRSDYLIDHRMFNPKVFIKKIGKMHFFEDEASKYLVWMVDNNLLTQQTGRDYHTVYFQITKDFCKACLDECGLVIKMPDIPLRYEKKKAKKTPKKTEEAVIEDVLKEFGDNSEVLKNLGVTPFCEGDYIDDSDT